MKDHGATTVWENWNGEESHNHPMFAAGARHLFTGVLGIRQRTGTAGWKDVIISPCKLPEGQSVRGSFLTPQGRLSVWLEQDGIHVQAPEGVKVCVEK